MHREVSAKIVLLGESAVGKSSLVQRYVRQEFSPNQEATIGAAFLAQTHVTDTGTVKFEVWDTAGQERYRSLAPMYYRGAVGAIVVYDITSSDSLRKARGWIRELCNNCEGIAIVTVGNKCDLEEHRAVNIVDGQQLAIDEGTGFFETSAKDGTNVGQVFDFLAKKILEKGLGTGAGSGVRPTGARGLEAPGKGKKKKQQEGCSC